MSTVKKYSVFLLLLFGCLFSHAQTPMRDANTLRQEQAALSTWVIRNSGNKITQSEADTMVKQAYAYAQKNNLDPLLVLSVMRPKGKNASLNEPFSSR